MNGLVFFIVGLASGAAAAWLFLRNGIQSKALQASRELETKACVAEAKAAGLSEQHAKFENEITALREAFQAEAEAKTVALTKLEAAGKNLEEQKQLVDLSREQLVDTFKALSDDALKSNNAVFLEIAKNSLESVLNQAKGDMGERQEKLKGLVAPIEETLKRFDSHVAELEQKRLSAYVSLEEQLRSLYQTQQLLQKETGSLVSALRTPHVRGQWGQMSLRRVVELAGMTEHCDFNEQVSVKTEDSRLQPDMVLHLPGSKQVVIDSKVSLYAYMESIEAVDENARKEAISRHAQQIRKHMNDLSSKSYWSQFPKAPEFVIMFIPGEPFVSAAVEKDPALLEDAVENRIIIATPTTLIALMRAIAYGWRQEQVAKNTQEIADLGRQVYERFAAFLAHLSKTRGSLEQSVFNFNRTVASLEGRILPSLRKFKDLGATGADDLPQVDPIEQSPRQIEALESRQPEPEPGNLF